jgi:mannose/fructose/N-acetylgalactosamine-specific phosphotransferase system component IID
MHGILIASLKKENIGPLLMFLSGILWTVVMIPLFFFGYRQGIGVTKEVSESGRLTRITDEDVRGRSGRW